MSHAENRSPADLGRLLAERRARDRISLRDAAEQIGVSFNTLARVEKGRIPDVQTFQRISEWLGVSPADFFQSRARTVESTPDVIASHLSADPALTDEAADKIANIVSELYGALARRTGTTAVHLRSARTLPADAAIKLAHLVEQMRRSLEKEDAVR